MFIKLFSTKTQYVRMFQATFIVCFISSLAACSDSVDTAAESQAVVDAEQVQEAGGLQSITEASLVRNPAAGELIGFNSPNGAFTWLGIPYAQAPIGNLRWRAPRPMAPWENSLLAGEFGSPCVQLVNDIAGSGQDPDDNYGSEDCLYLNIYAPPTLADTAANAKLPVMVWIHGGGNTIGEASQFDGSLLAMQQNVLVVTINYRLGPFGWFKQKDITGDGESEADRSGNFGTLDIIRALQWTHDNIQVFGGDAENVTIFGESAGGRNVISLLTSPLAEGLFHRAISQSGSSFFVESDTAEFYHPYSGNAIVSQIVASQNLQTIGQLRELNAHRLIKGLGKVSSGGLPLLNVPNVFRDGYVLPLDAGLKSFRSGNYNQVPVMLGTNRDEQKLFMFLDDTLSKKWFGVWQTLKDSDNYNLDAYYMSSRWRIAGAEEPARAINAPVYVYRFDWDELATPLGMDFPDMIGAAHGLEMAFVFGEMSMGSFDQIIITEDNKPARDQLSKAMMSYWANFARSGNPNKGVNVAVQWLPWSAQEQYLIFDTEVEENTGIRMSTETTTFKGLMLQLQGDERFETDQERCDLLLDLIQSSPELLAWKAVLGC